MAEMTIHIHAKKSSIFSYESSTFSTDENRPAVKCYESFRLSAGELLAKSYDFPRFTWKIIYIRRKVALQKVEFKHFGGFKSTVT
jgi:hypothetical protein